LLPKIVDKDQNDVVKLKADFGAASNFLKLDGVTSITCSDISVNSNAKSGMYTIRLILDDGRD
jgi:hypothetical protein